MKSAMSLNLSTGRRSTDTRPGCDGCSVFKVKCSKQHPQCHFCRERGLACSYTLSKRPSKPLSCTNDWARTTQPDTHHTAEAKPSNLWPDGATGTRVCENEQTEFDMAAILESSMDFSVDAQGQETFGDEFANNPEFEYNPDNDKDINATCDSLIPSTLLAYMSDELSDTALKRDENPLNLNITDFAIETEDQDSALTSPVSNYQSRATNLRGRLKDIEPCSPRRPTCLVSALKLLQELHIPPSVCLSAGATVFDTNSPQPRLTDCVLSTNREVIRLMSGILECSCSTSAQIQLILTTICCKLTAWCRAIIRNCFENSSITWSPCENHDVNHEEHTERVLHQPITVGEYSIDVVLEQKIRAHVVFDELQHVRALTKNLSQRVVETKFGKLRNNLTRRSESGPTTGSPLVKAVENEAADKDSTRLTGFLDKQLQIAREDVAIQLKNGHGSTYAARQPYVMDG